MTTTRPPRIAIALLRWLTSDNEALLGDVVEQYQARPSRLWLWNQVLWAAFLRPGNPGDAASATDGSLFKLNPIAHPATRPIMPAVNLPPVRINVSGIQAEGIGGLGLLSVIIVITLVMPAAWWLAVMGVVGGIVLGGLLVMTHRRYGLSNGKGDGPGELFDLHDTSARPGRPVRGARELARRTREGGPRALPLGA